MSPYTSLVYILIANFMRFSPGLLERPDYFWFDTSNQELYMKSTLSQAMLFVWLETFSLNMFIGKRSFNPCNFCTLIIFDAASQRT